MVMATISFMNSNEGGVGSRRDFDSVKRDLANKSMETNMKNPLFVQLFKKKLH